MRSPCKHCRWGAFLFEKPNGTSSLLPVKLELRTPAKKAVKFRKSQSPYRRS